MEQQRITSDELAQRLVNSRKIMQKVDTGDFERGNINEELLKGPPNEIEDPEIPKNRPIKPIGTVNSNKINQSKLPDNIKKAMIENPIPQISLNENIDMNFVNKAKKLMEQDNPLTRMGQDKKNTQQITSSDLEKKLTPIIESIIRKVMDEKLSQILAAQQLSTINENLVLKVGDSIFHGKITGVNNTKSKK